MRRAAPRPLALALDSLTRELGPATTLAAVQRAWPEVVGPAVAREAQPVSERDGVLTVGCRSAVWAHELDLMAPAIAERLNDALSSGAITALRCSARAGAITR